MRYQVKFYHSDGRLGPFVEREAAGINEVHDWADAQLVSAGLADYMIIHEDTDIDAEIDPNA